MNLILIALVLVFAATVLIVYVGLQWLMERKGAVQKRLREIETPALGASQQSASGGIFGIRWLEPVVHLVEPKEDWRRSQVDTRLVRAGYRSERAITIFYTVKILFALLFPLVLVVFAWLFLGQTEFDRKVLILATIGLALGGYYLPDYFVARKIAERRRRIIEGFPDALDMLVVCVEAGLGLDAAIQRVGDELRLSHAALADEFNLLSLELRAGKSRAEALKALGERVDVDDIRSLTTILIQAEQFGTSIARALREHAEEMRSKRIQLAKEKAAKLPVKLIFPVVGFIFPALLLVVVGPAVIRIYQTLFQVFTRH